MYYERLAKPFSLTDRCVDALVIKCYDGDTIKCVFGIEDMFHGKQFLWSCRLSGIDTPELRGSGPREKAWAVAARDVVRDMILDKEIKLEILGEDKYGRLLTIPYMIDETGKHINVCEVLIEKRLAVPYQGVGSKQEWETSTPPEGFNIP